MSEIALTSGTERALLHRMNKVSRALLAWMGLAWVTAAALAAPSATNSTSRPQPARWLLVVDTSAGMERRARAMAGVIDELLSSGMNGQMRAGDELGIWTYNKKLLAGVAPMQIWDPASSNLISSRSAQFIGGQKYQDKPRLENVVPELNRVVKASRKLTILLFSDGSQKISGTALDDAINSAYAEHRAELAKTRMPLVTVLRSERGDYIGQSVSFAPWPIEFPPFSIEEERKVTPAAKTGEPRKSIIIGTPRKAASTTNALLISRSTNAVSPAPIAEVTPVPVTPVEPTPTVEPALPTPVPAPEPVLPVSQPVELAKVETAPPAPVQVAPPAAAPQVAALPAPLTAPESANASTFGTRKGLLILGMGCMWVAIVIALVLARRSRRAHSGSLITRSFDRNQH